MGDEMGGFQAQGQIGTREDDRHARPNLPQPFGPKKSTQMAPERLLEGKHRSPLLVVAAQLTSVVQAAHDGLGGGNQVRRQGECTELQAQVIPRAVAPDAGLETPPVLWTRVETGGSPPLSTTTRF